MSRDILAIDIGSIKISAVIADIAEDNTISVIGSGVVESKGVKKGVVNSIEQASKAIKTAILDAKRVSGREIKSAVVSISGVSAKSLDTNGIISIPTKEIGIKDIEKVMSIAIHNLHILHEYEVLHALPYNFKVDDQEYIEDPLGMNASRLEVEVHIIAIKKSNVNNLKKAIKGAGINVDNIVLDSYASSISTLADDEKEGGVVLLDMGGTTSGILIHSGNAIVYNRFLEVGSHNVTKDLSTALNTPINIAEKIKIQYGALLSDEDDVFELPLMGDESVIHKASPSMVNNVISARVEETFVILSKYIEESGYSHKARSGIVLTGGFSRLIGIRELATSVFGSIPVRVASPFEVKGLFDNLKSAEYSTVIGLIMHSVSSYTPYEIDVNKRIRHKNETLKEKHKISLTQTANLTSQDENIEDVNMVGLPPEKMKRNNEVSPIDRFINWATQLF